MNNPPRDQNYQVPRRFGLRAALIATAVFALLLSVIKWTDASPVALIFYASFVMVVGAAQVVFERSPRLSSILAGALFLLLVKTWAFIFDNGLEPISNGLFMGLFSEGHLVFTLLYGALYGYLSGTLLAGVYLVTDKMQFVIHWGDKQRRMPTEVL